jgi:hypothetical protein
MGPCLSRASRQEEPLLPLPPCDSNKSMPLTLLHDSASPVAPPPYAPLITTVPTGIGPYLAGIPQCTCTRFPKPHMCTVLHIEADEDNNITHMDISATCIGGFPTEINRPDFCHVCHSRCNIVPLESLSYCARCVVPAYKKQFRDLATKQEKFREMCM